MVDFRDGRVNPYATSYGRLINTDKLKKELINYTATLDTGINYGYILEKYNIYFILGLNEKEKDITVFNHPFFFSNHKGQYSLAVDLRQYAKADLYKERIRPDDITKLIDVLRNPVDAQFVINRAMLCGMVATEQTGTVRSSYKALMVSFALFVSTIMNNIVNLGVRERLIVEVFSAFYLYSLLTAKGSFSLDELKEVVSNQLDRTKLYVAINKSQVFEILEPLDKEITNFAELVQVIKTYLPEGQASLIDVKVFNSLIGNMWMGPGGNELLYIALENVGTWMTIFYYSLEELTYKKTRIMEMIKKFGLKSLSADSKKNFDIFLKECNPLNKDI